MTELAPGWTLTTLGEIAETRLGKMLSAKARVGSSPQPYLRNKNVQWGTFDLTDVIEMDFGPDEIERFTVRPGDLLVCEGGDVGRAAIWRGQLPWVGYQKALHRIRPSAGISAEYLMYAFRWFGDHNAFAPFVTGSTIKHLPQEDLRRLPIPLPSTSEQRRIVAVIEEQFSRLDAAEGALNRCHARLRVLRFSVLHSLAKEAWPESRLGDVAEVLGGKTPKGLKSSPDGTIPFYKVGDMNAAEGRRMARARVYLTQSNIESYRLRLWPAGTVIFPKQGGAIATNKKRVLGQAASCDLNTMGVIPSEKILPDYVWLFLEIIDLSTLSDGSVVPQIKRGRVADIVIPLPPLQEQTRIIEENQGRLSLIDGVAGQVGAALKRAQVLRRSVLEHAFTGRLVAPDPADEPASLLVERITTEAARATKPSRRRRKVPA